MKLIITYILTFSLFLLACKDQIKSEVPILHLYPKGLKFGDYKVGYQTIWTYDITRPAVPYADWNGKLYPTRETKGRQFQINIWYPSNDLNSQQRLKVGNYMNLYARQIDFKETPEGIEFGKAELVSKLKDLGGFDSLSVDDLARLEDLACQALFNLNPINEKFPLILYPNGLAPFTNSIAAEYLTSHGFVVVGFAPKGQFKLSKDISTRGADIVSDDIKFVLSEVLKLPYVNSENVGIIANAIESSYCVGYQAKNRTLKSLVSLEGGFLSDFEQTILEDLPFYEPLNIDIPILAIYSPHPSIDPKYIKHLKYSKRYLAHFPHMREFDYLNYGMYNNIVPNIIGEPRGNIPKSYTKAHQLVKDFFEHTLKGEKPDFDNDFIALKPTVSDSTHIWESIPNIPDLAIVKHNFVTYGFSYIDSLYQSHKEHTSQPFSKDFIKDLRIWVSWKKDPEYDTRKKLYQIAVESYPTSSLMNYYLASYSLRNGDTARALLNYKRTLKKLKLDNDEDLTDDIRVSLRERSKNALKNISN